MENLCPTPNEAITTVTAGVDGGLAGSIVRLVSEDDAKTTCWQCHNGLTELERMACEANGKEDAEYICERCAYLSYK